MLLYHYGRRNNLVRSASRSFFFNHSKPSNKQSVGVFGMVGLHKVEDWQRLSEEAIQKCNDLRSELKQSPPSTAQRQLIILDSISNTICSVIDGAELCRNVHSDELWRNNAEASFALLSSYINELNTDSSMYDVLVRITEDTNIMKTLGEEDRRFANSLRSEFERDGIQLVTSQRNELRELNDRIDEIQTAFSQNIVNGVQLLHVPKKLLANLHPSIWSDIPQTSAPADCVALSTDPRTVGAILSMSPSAQLREAMYKNMHNICNANISVLHQLVCHRQRLAEKLGHDSFAHLMLQDKIINSPDKVKEFLYSLSQGLKPKAEAELKELLALKLAHEGAIGAGIEQWDLPFYTAVAKSRNSQSVDIQASEHLPLKKCISGLCLLTEKLFGVTVERSLAPSNETWDGAYHSNHPIEKLTFFHHDQGMLGTIYLDLHPRPYKFGHSAHFTVSCGCETSSKNQLPVVALVMNFQSVESTCYLSHTELETLLHEYGHAVHSLLSRTKYQHLSGTRVSPDFVETPSQLFENFCWNSDSLKLMSSHATTGQPISESLLNSLEQGKSQFSALDTLHQVLLALFDMELYSLKKVKESRVEGGEKDHISEEAIMQLAHDLHVKVMPEDMPPPVGANWPNRVSHLTTYGATYYGYLLNKAYATQLWEHLFAGDPLSRSSGEKLWLELLRPGGSKEPMELLVACLDGRSPSLDPFFDHMGIIK